ncbi:hypothetical protein J3R83DRAFT_13800 [Lanmaoa asiatica]|nr:hypothetical protein J3R83DRAFT_13800 [Lanmaoa asiatica]
MSQPTSSENIYDRCRMSLFFLSPSSAQLLLLQQKWPISFGVGFGVGVVASVILFRRRTWPIALSSGFGMGAAYADCDRSFNPARVPGTRIITQPEQTN